MTTTAIVWLPAAVLAIVAFGGAWPAAALAPRFSADARAALAAPLGAAAFACASATLYTGLPIRVLFAAYCVVAVAAVVAIRRDVAELARAAFAPALVAATALAIVSAPSIAAGSWDAAAVDNTDPYLWVSQAKSFLDGPPPQPRADFPDRIAYDRIDELHWPVGLPAGVAGVAAVARDDPAQTYGAFAAVLAVLLALVVYACGRACIGWSRPVASTGAVLVTANAYMLYSTFNGWQAQVALTTFGTLFVFALRSALEPDASRREQAVVALAAAAGVATYGVLFGIYACLGALVVAVALAFRRVDRRAALRVLAGCTLATAALGTWSLVQAARALPVILRLPDSASWHLYAHGLPAEAVGLIPRIGTAHRPPFGWTVIASAAAAALLAAGLWRARRRADVLLVGGIAAIGAISLLQIPGPSPYVSMKVVGYAAPLLTMVALHGIVGSRLPRARVAVAAAAATCFAFSTGLVAAVDLTRLDSTQRLATIRDTLAGVDADARIAVRVDDEWDQSWSVYYLRDRPLTVTAPNIFLTGFGIDQPAFARRTADLVLEQGGARSAAVWRGDGLVLRRADGEGASG